MSNGVPPLAKWNVQDSAPAAGKSHYHWKFVSLADIGNVQRAMLTHPLKIWLINTDLNASNGYRTKMGPRSQNVSVAEPQHHIIDPTNPRRALDDSIQHRLHVRRRAADDAEHLGSCCLMLQSFAQFGVPFLQFLEQAHVLDRDYGLVGKRLQQLDLRRGEGAYLDATGEQSPQKIILLAKRNAQ